VNRVCLKGVALAGALALIAGCSLLESNVPDATVFVLRPIAPVAAATTVNAGLTIPRPVVDAALETDRIALARPGNRLDYYAGGRWGGPLSVVLDSLVAQRLRASGAYSMVDTDRGGYGAQYVLAITVRRFEAEYGADAEAAPTARVMLECTVGDRTARRTVASFNVETSAAASENRLSAVVAALDRAANEAITQVIERSSGAITSR